MSEARNERKELNQPTCYASRDLEELGKYYFRHLNAMTREGLDSKSSIAAELAVRDMIIDDLLSKHNTKLNHEDKTND